MGKITINGQICEFVDGESILKIARKNDIFIPAICYVSCCSPTLACRLCMVEADGKIVYSCNAKAKDGQNVITNSPELHVARKEIMKTYLINHPLECGVCDQSGECELQNYTLMLGVDEVNYSIKETHKPIKNFSEFIDYDPSLCIVCERCITVCKDKIGENALKTTPRNADMPPKELKESMQKDAYAVWNKFQKSLIEQDKSCSNCGECEAVCPVGALGIKYFTYSSNAWELKKIASSNPHSSDCELIYYEVKQKGIEDSDLKIYRVTNDYEFGEINKAARFGFDFHNENAHKNESKFNKIINLIKNNEIKNIKFNSFITNEEAQILSNLKEKFGLNLINDEALKYQNFLKNFEKYSGKNLFSANSQNIKNADFIVVAGSFLRHDNPNLSYKLNNALKINKASAIYFHTIKDSVVESFSKNLLFCKHSPKFDIEILLLILFKFGKNLPSWLEKYKINYLETLNLDEDEFGKLVLDKKELVLVIGEDFVFSKNAENLAKLTGMIEAFTPFKTLIIPPRTNSLGVALNCKLDDVFQNGKTLGYNENGDFKFGIFNSDLDAPALTQQNGSFINYDKRVVPVKKALNYKGYYLSDLAKALSIEAPKITNLDNFYKNSGENCRGFEIKPKISSLKTDEFKITNLNQNLENFIYKANQIGAFSKFTNSCKFLKSEVFLYAGVDFMQKFGLKEGDLVQVDNEKVKVKKDDEIDGAYLPFYDENLEFGFKTRYKEIELKAIKC